MRILRSQFLNTAAFLSGPNDPPGGGDGKPTTLNEDVGAEDDTGGADDTNAEGGADAGDDTGGADDDAGGDTEDDSDEDDDPDLADLPPEVRKKVKAKIERETNWRDRQINKLTAKRRQAQADNDAMATIIDGQGRTVRAPAAKPGENLTAEQIEERARILAGQMSAQDRYDEDCNNANAAGVSTFGKKWNSALTTLNKLGNVDLPDMVDIMATEQPHVVLFELSDPETYQRVMDLPPAKRRTEYVKLSLKEAPKKGKTVESKRPGDAPPPPRIGGGNRQVAAQSVDLYDDKVSDEVWYAERNRTRRKKFSDHV